MAAALHFLQKGFFKKKGPSAKNAFLKAIKKEGGFFLFYLFFKIWLNLKLSSYAGFLKMCPDKIKPD
jgi:hypothetical protein